MNDIKTTFYSDLTKKYESFIALVKEGTDINNDRWKEYDQYVVNLNKAEEYLGVIDMFEYKSIKNLASLKKEDFVKKAQEIIKDRNESIKNI